VLLAATAAAIGFAFDAGTGNKELSAVFAVCYVTGCVLAVLAVRQSGVFTAVIQPPLILFFAVPGAYFLFHGSAIGGLKDILINCGYPLIERFPLMFITSAVVLILGMVRWYLGVVARRGVSADAADAVVEVSESRTAGKGAAAETTVMDAVEATPRRRRRDHSIDRPSRAGAVAAAATAADEPPRRPRKTPKATPVAGASRSRHVRPPEPEPELGEPPISRPRRRPAAQAGPPIEPPPEPRRRPRPPQSREAREPRRNLPPIEGHGAQERPERPERRDRPLRAERPERSDRPERRRRPNGYEPYEPYDSYEPRPSEPRPTTGANGSHHPVSRVRYRGDDDAESRTEHRTRPRRPRSADADSWEFDV
jgi:hypothetical protein